MALGQGLMAGRSVPDVLGSGTVLLVIVLNATFESGAGTVGIISVFAVVTLVPSVFIWETGNRLWRALALGFAAACVGIGFYAFVWHPFSTMSAAEVGPPSETSWHPAIQPCTCEFAADSETSLEQKPGIVRAARLVGQSEASTALPAPRPDILADVERHCGAAP